MMFQHGRVLTAGLLLVLALAACQRKQQPAVDAQRPVLDDSEPVGEEFVPVVREPELNRGELGLVLENSAPTVNRKTLRSRALCRCGTLARLRHPASSRVACRPR